MNFKNQLRCVLRTTIALSVVTIAGSCEDFLDVGAPKTRVTTEIVFDSDVTAYSALAGMYSEMQSAQSFLGGGIASIHMLGGLSADEFFASYSGIGYTPFELNTLVAESSDVKTTVWEPGYKLIYQANSILRGIANSVSLTETAENQLEGESKFVRALCYFYLTNLFGEVPLVLTTDYRVSSKLSRSSVEAVYQQILQDLLDARSLLPDNYLVSSNERVRPNRYVVDALLARVYLYLEDWDNAELHATNLIGQVTLFDLEPDLNKVFLKGSKEAIWQLKPVNPIKNTNEGSTFYDYSRVILRPSILDLFSVDDNRRTAWVRMSTVNAINFYHPYKYKVFEDSKPQTEYSIVFRLAELHLVRAEARARLGNTGGAQDDINEIRNRAGLADTGAADEESLIAEIKLQRQLELFTEYGHRWFDLKRWEDADAVLGPLKGSNWQSTDVLYPVPDSERQLNLNLSQNPGY